MSGADEPQRLLKVPRFWQLACHSPCQVVCKAIPSLSPNPHSSPHADSIWQLGAPTVAMFVGLRLVCAVVLSKIVLGATTIKTAVQVGSQHLKA